MMQQKERELATLHEETETQVCVISIVITILIRELKYAYFKAGVSNQWVCKPHMARF